MKEHKVLLCWTAITQTTVLLWHLDQSLLAATHRFHTDLHYTDRLRALGLREDLKSSCPPLLVLFYLQKWLENRRTLVEHIVRDAPRFNGERAHWVDYKEKLDDVLFSHRSSLRDILQGQTRPDKYVLIPNDVTVVPTYVELRRSIYETQPIPEQWRGNAEREAHWSTGQDVARAAAELAGPVTPAAPIAGSVIGHTDLTLPNSLGLHGRFQVIAGSTAGTSFLKKPACELWDRENDELFRILYHTCKNVAYSLLKQLRPVDGSEARGNGQEAFNFLRNRYEGRSEAWVRSLLA